MGPKNISASNFSPVNGLYNTSLPCFWYPNKCNYYAISCTFWLLKGVPSASYPLILATLLARHSMRWPIVILLGIACGLIIISGVIPYLVYGISSIL